MTNLFGLSEVPPEPNPMVIKHGILDGKKCKTCSHLLRCDYHNKTYYKCKIRGITSGAGTDHRLKWSACKLHKDGESHDD